MLGEETFGHGLAEAPTPQVLGSTLNPDSKPYKP